MQKYVSDSTVKCYKNELVTLMFWLFDRDPEKYFHDWIVDNAIKLVLSNVTSLKLGMPDASPKLVAKRRAKNE